MIHSTPRKQSSSSRPRRARMTLDLQPGPRAATLQFILAYSKALKVMQAPPIGAIDIILN